MNAEISSAESELLNNLDFWIDRIAGSWVFELEIKSSNLIVYFILLKYHRKWVIKTLKVQFKSSETPLK